MSAVRNERRGTRHTKPYQRATPPKKSTWSFTGLLSLLNPLRSRESEEPELLPTTHSAQSQVSATRTSQRTQPPSLPVPPSLPPSSSAPPTLKDVDNPMASIDKYLGHKKSLNEKETQELMSFVHQHVSPVKKHEPFRFTSTPPVSTSQSMPNLERQAPKTISRNPNGVYRWEGGGSSKRNRYRSPAFGSSSSAASGLKLRPPAETPKTDTKRRRLGEDTSSTTNTTTPPSGVRSNAPSPAKQPFPSSQPSPPSTPEKIGVSKSMPSLRVATPAKPTAPAIPSPLRQAWGGQGDSPPTRQTRAASFMTELIKEVVPPLKPDLSNPYQTASPVRTQGQPRKVSAKRPRATGKPTKPTVEAELAKEEPSEKPKEDLPPHALIEATVPKGSKRSRPPTKAAVDEESPAMHVDEPTVVEEPAQAKPKKATLNGHGPPPSHPSSVSRPTFTVEEVEDVDMPSVQPVEVIEPQEDSTKPAVPPVVQVNVNGVGKHSGGLKSSLPREPSKLRMSFQPETNDSPTSPSNPSIVEKENQAIPSVPSSAKDVARSSISAPTFTFDVPTPAPTFSKAQQAALKANLPTFAFTVDTLSMSPSSAAAMVAASANKATLPSFDFGAPATSTSTSGFDYAKAGLKAPETKAGWKCDMCMCDNPSSATEKCTVCEGPAPASVSSSKPAPVAFDWSKAGMKPPASSSSWKCSVCLCDNPSNAKEKCTVCESPAPKAPTPSAPAVFDWSKAGMKPPSQAGWKCDMCLCDNPASAKEMCTVCEAPAPASAR